MSDENKIVEVYITYHGTCLLFYNGSYNQFSGNLENIKYGLEQRLNHISNDSDVIVYYTKDEETSIIVELLEVDPDKINLEKMK